MLRNILKKDLEAAVKKLGVEPLKVEVRRTSDLRFGDYATNVALKIRSSVLGYQLSDRGQPVSQLSDKQKTGKLVSENRKQRTDNKQSPLEIANKLADSLKDLPYVKKLEVKDPGFINFFIKTAIWQKQVADVLKDGDKFGSNTLGKGKKARVEFVSANPTGPLHFGNARGGPIGDCLASVLEFCGYQVLREYYHNDVGEQVRKLGKSVLNVIQGKKLEDQEYKGQYVHDLVHIIQSSKYEDKPDSQSYSKPGSEYVDKQGATIGKKAVEFLFKDILRDCASMGIKFDKVYPESEFATTESTEKALKALKEKGFLRTKEAAIWFAPNDQFLKDRECVLVKSDGSYTYFANDIAYHRLKFQEGYDLVIDILGANHHGHVPRLKAAVSALGYDPNHFHVILYQWVRFKHGQEIVKMAKRAGTFITAREVLDEVGRDATRFFILMHDANSHIDFDLDLAKRKSKENPVYYVQYAHARICSILRKLKMGPVSRFPPASAQSGQKSKRDGLDQSDLRAVGSLSTTATPRYELLTTNHELDLIKQITRLPELVEDIAESFAVHRLTSYATQLADSFHKFYENCQVLGAGGDLESARLSLILATKIALENTLKLLGVSAPEKM